MFAYFLFNVFLKLYIKFTSMSCTNKVCLAGKTVIVTGSSTGIGFETALECAKRGARVIIACNDHLEGTSAVQNIKLQTGNSNIVFKIIELASLQSVRQFAKYILKTEDRLDILINNAGVMALGNQITEDGLQLEMQINYFAHVLLTLLLVDLLKKSSPSRIVNVSSLAAKSSRLKIDELNDYKSHWQVYANSKLCNILFTQELARILKDDNVSVFSVHPGATATNILSHRFPLTQACLSFLKILVKVCLTGKTVIVTGSNTGIGFETALECAKRGARVIIACRDHLKGTLAVQNIKTLTGNSNIVLKIIDLASLQSVRQFATQILKTENRLDILINNAGAIALGNQITEDGLQLEMQINYFAHVLLTLLLIDLLKKSSPSRIVNVSSIAAKSSKLKIDELNDYKSHWQVYANSKLGNILFTQELARRLRDDNVSVFSLHPGAIATDFLAKHVPVVGTCLGFISRKVLKSPEEGAQTTIYTATEPGIEHLSGSFFSECKYQEHYKSAKNPTLAKQLWEKTMEILNYNN